LLHDLGRVNRRFRRIRFGGKKDVLAARIARDRRRAGDVGRLVQVQLQTAVRQALQPGGVGHVERIATGPVIINAGAGIRGGQAGRGHQGQPHAGQPDAGQPDAGQRSTTNSRTMPAAWAAATRPQAS